MPKDRQQGFVFNAKKIWGDEKVRSGWPDEDRYNLLHGMMHVPADLGLAVAIGMVRRTTPSPLEQTPDYGALFNKKMALHQWDHFLAFSFCLYEADRYIRTYAHESEVGTVVAENLPEITNLLSRAIPMVRAKPRDLRLALQEQITRVIQQNQGFRIERLVDTVHFVDKNNAPLLQIADACAFGMRRWLSDQSSGQEFAKSVAADHKLDADKWSGVMQGALFYWHPRKPANQQKKGKLTRALDVLLGRSA